MRFSRRKRRAQHQRLSGDKRNIGKDEEQAECPASNTAERKRGQHHLHNWPPAVLPNVPSAKRNPNTSLHTGLCLLPKLPTSMAVITFVAASGWQLQVGGKTDLHKPKISPYNLPRNKPAGAEPNKVRASAATAPHAATASATTTQPARNTKK